MPTETAVDSGARYALLKVVNERLTAREFEVPILPDVAMKAFELAGQPDVGAASLAALIQRDPAIASHILRVANSPAYSSRIEITSLRQAIARLGIQVIAELTMSIAMKSQFEVAPGWRADLIGDWKHAVASSLWAKELGRLRRRSVEACFLCGLLHTIGRPVTYKLISDACDDHKTQLPIDAARSIVDGWYVEVGAVVAESWSLPGAIGESIAYHRFYDQTPTYVDEAKITFAASWLGERSLTDEPVDADELTTADIARDLSLYPDECAGLIEMNEPIRTTVDALAS